MDPYSLLSGPVEAGLKAALLRLVAGDPQRNARLDQARQVFNYFVRKAFQSPYRAEETGALVRSMMETRVQVQKAGYVGIGIPEITAKFEAILHEIDTIERMVRQRYAIVYRFATSPLAWDAEREYALRKRMGPAYFACLSMVVSHRDRHITGTLKELRDMLH